MRSKLRCCGNCGCRCQTRRQRRSPLRRRVQWQTALRFSAAALKSSVLRYWWSDMVSVIASSSLRGRGSCAPSTHRPRHTRCVVPSIGFAWTLHLMKQPPSLNARLRCLVSAACCASLRHTNARSGCSRVFYQLQMTAEVVLRRSACNEVLG